MGIIRNKVRELPPSVVASLGGEQALERIADDIYKSRTATLSVAKQSKLDEEEKQMLSLSTELLTRTKKESRDSLEKPFNKETLATMVGSTNAGAAYGVLERLSTTFNMNDDATQTAVREVLKNSRNKTAEQMHDAIVSDKNFRTVARTISQRHDDSFSEMRRRLGLGYKLQGFSEWSTKARDSGTQVAETMQRNLEAVASSPSANRADKLAEWKRAFDATTSNITRRLAADRQHANKWTKPGDGWREDEASQIEAALSRQFSALRDSYNRIAQETMTAAQPTAPVPTKTLSKSVSESPGGRFISNIFSPGPPPQRPPNMSDALNRREP